jgi:Lon protease-like protein
MEHVLPEVASDLPIFPLPGAVLMPGESLPLHVFEPRYRALVNAAMSRSRHLAIATLQPGYERDYQGMPAVFPEIGVGRIVRHHALPDGRSNILLTFVTAARIDDELRTGELFRRVRCTPIDPPDPKSYPNMAALRVLAGQVLAQLASDANPDQLFALDGAEWLDTMARAVLAAPDERRRYLVARRGDERVALVQGALVSLLEDADHSEAD